MNPVASHPARRARHAAQLAWARRQSDPSFACAQAALARARLPSTAVDERARLDLAEAEMAWLQGDLARCEALCRQAEQAWGAAGDAGGRADLALLRAQVLHDQGQGHAALALLQQAEAVARSAGDRRRERQLQALGAYWSLAYRYGDALARWGPRLQALDTDDDASLAMLVQAYTAQVAMHEGDLAGALVAFGRAHVHALDSGALRHAITAATNLSATWSNLHRHDEALSWAEQALALARPLGWPVSIGQSLRMLGGVLFNLGRLDGARAAFEEALQVMAPMAASRHVHSVRMALGDVLMAQGAPHEAAALLAAVEAQLRRQGQPELLALALCARADALGAAGDRSTAVGLAQEALALARREGARLYEIDSRVSLAALHAQDPATARGHLQAALACGRALAGWEPSAGLLTDLADCHLACGDARAAWPLLQEAHRLHAAAATRRAQEHAAVAEAAQTLARERAAAEQARREARQREREAELLAEANRMLAALGRLGRRLLLQTTRAGVTAHLAAGAPRLLPVDTVMLLAPGQPLPPAGLHIVRRLRLQEADHGTLVATLRRPADAADRQLLRTLAAWVALACAHVAALQELGRARGLLLQAHAQADGARHRLDQAVQQRRRFAGYISHDLRSPLATLQGLLDTLRAPPPVLQPAERRRYAQQAREVAARLQGMVAELRELARVETGVRDPQPTALPLPALVQRVFARLELDARRRGLRLELLREQELPAALADAGMVERVLVNLLDNAVRHAVPGGRVRVELASDRACLRVAVLDDGPGVAPALRPLLLRRPCRDPLRPGSAGLGLLAVQRLLALHGTAVRMPGRPGWGGAFEFSLPAAAG